MHGRIPHYRAIAVLALAGGLGAALPPSPPSAASTADATATQTAPAIRTKFSNGDPIGDFFSALAQRFDVMVVQSKDVDAFVLKDFEMPDTLPAALQVARQSLEPQGYAIRSTMVGTHTVLRVLTTAEDKKLALAVSAVSSGPDPDAIDVTNPTEPVTHLLPVNHPEMIDVLRRTAAQDPEVKVDVTGGAGATVNLILTGPAIKVQQAVVALDKLDEVAEAKVVVRTLPLVHLDAKTTAESLNQGFARDGVPLKAGLDLRSNSVILSGPEDKVMELMVSLIGQDAKRGPLLPRPALPPATAPADTPGFPLQPPRLPVPDASQPGARNTSRQLDETPAGGDNTRLIYSAERPSFRENSREL